MKYPGAVLSLFREQAHAGTLDGARHGHAVSADGAVEVRFSVRLAKGTIVAARHGARGCPYVLAACEWICRQAEGRETDVLEELTLGRMVETLSAPVEKTGSLMTVEDAVRGLATRLRECTAKED